MMEMKLRLSPYGESIMISKKSRMIAFWGARWLLVIFHVVGEKSRHIRAMLSRICAWSWEKSRLSRGCTHGRWTCPFRGSLECMSRRNRHRRMPSFPSKP